MSGDDLEGPKEDGCVGCGCLILILLLLPFLPMFLAGC